MDEEQVLNYIKYMIFELGEMKKCRDNSVNVKFGTFEAWFRYYSMQNTIIAEFKENQLYIVLRYYVETEELKIAIRPETPFLYWLNSIPRTWFRYFEGQRMWDFKQVRALVDKSRFDPWVKVDSNKISQPKVNTW